MVPAIRIPKKHTGARRGNKIEIPNGSCKVLLHLETGSEGTASAIRPSMLAKQ